jgi:hypothetical protein
MRVRSQWPLPYGSRARDGLAEIGLVRGSAARFARAVETARATGRDERTWLRGIDLEDGQTYLRWIDRFEFLVSPDGRSIAARPLNGESGETFHTYLLGPALSFALLKQGFDPLHATAVTIDGAAVGFLGDAGFGKSSLGAAFLQSGHRLLTDDLLVLSASRDGFIAHPGPPRIKLFPEIARAVFARKPRGAQMAATTSKLVIPLQERHTSTSAVPLRALYVLAPPERRRSRSRVTIRRASKRAACLALLRNAFNMAVDNPQRLGRQFAFAASVAAAVPIKHIAYPRGCAELAGARDAILADLARA